MELHRQVRSDGERLVRAGGTAGQALRIRRRAPQGRP
jgi:hypothetical protein